MSFSKIPLTLGFLLVAGVALRAASPEFGAAIRLRDDEDYAGAYEKAGTGAEMGDPACLWLMGELHADGYLDRNPSEEAIAYRRGLAKPYFEKAAALGYKPAMVRLASFTDDPDEKLRLLIPAVSAETPSIAPEIAEIYERGSAKRAPVPAAAIRYYRMAAGYAGITPGEKKSYEQRIARLQKPVTTTPVAVVKPATTPAAPKPAAKPAPAPAVAQTPAPAAPEDFAPPAAKLTGEARKTYFEKTLIETVEAKIKARRIGDPDRPKPPEAILKKYIADCRRANGDFKKNKDAAARCRARGAALAGYLTGLYASNLPAAEADMHAYDAMEEMIVTDFPAVHEAIMHIKSAYAVRALNAMTREARRELRVMGSHTVDEYLRKRDRPNEPAKPAPHHPPGFGLGGADLVAGYEAERKKSYGEALKYFLAGAKAGNARSAGAIAGMYVSGEGVPKDPGTAAAWFALAAERFDSIAINHFGTAFLGFSKVFEKNAPLALRFHEAAGTLGYGESKLAAASLLTRGDIGIPVDGPRALRWLDSAVNENDAAYGPPLRAWLNRGALYLEGAPGVAVDTVRAKADFERILADKEVKRNEAEGGYDIYLLSMISGAKDSLAILAEGLSGKAAADRYAALRKERLAKQTPPAKRPPVVAKTTVATGTASPASIVAALPPLPAPTPPAPVPVNGTHERKAKLAKGSPWTADDIIAALKAGKKPWDIADAIDSKCDGSLIDTPGYWKVRASAEFKAAKRLKKPTLLSSNLDNGLYNAERNGSEAVSRQADGLIAERRKALGLPAVRDLADTPELRARASAGDGRALYELALIYEATVTAEHPWPADYRQTKREFYEASKAALSGGYDFRCRRAAARLWEAAGLAGYAPAFGYVPTGKLPAGALESEISACRALAEAGDPHACRMLGRVYAQHGYNKTAGTGVRANCAEAEYWMTEAVARGYDSAAGRELRDPRLDLASVILLRWPNGDIPMSPVLDEAAWRSVRRWAARGGFYKDIADGFMAYAESGHIGNAPKSSAEMIAALPPEPAPVSPDEAKRLETASSPADLMRLADALAYGSGLRQDDARAVAVYRRALAAGAGPAAHRALAVHLKNGYGAARDLPGSLAARKAAAESGEADDLVALGEALSFRIEGVPETPDHAAALAAFDKAAAKGDARAMFLAAECARGAKDNAGYRSRMEKAAAMGHIPAFVGMAGLCVSDSDFNKRDYAASADWYGKAVAAGAKGFRRDWANALGLAGKGDEAARLYEEVIREQSDDYRSMYALAESLRFDRKHDEAAKWYGEYLKHAPYAPLSFDGEPTFDPEENHREFARRFVTEYEEEKNPAPNSLPYWRKRWRTEPEKEYTAEFRYGLIAAVSKDPYYARQGEWALARCAGAGFAPAVFPYYEVWAKTDKAAADKWVKGRADKGDTQAQLLLALRSVATDKAGALARIEALANAGNADAALRIGGVYLQGDGVPKDVAKGVAFIVKSSDSGYAPAQLKLGGALLKGESGVIAADPRRAVALLEKAASQQVFAPVAAQASYVLARIHDAGDIPGIPRSALKAADNYDRAIFNGLKDPAVIKRRSEISREASLEMKGGRSRK